MRRAAHREQVRRRAGVVAAVQAGKVVNDACGQKASEADAKLMQLQRRAAFFLRDHAELRRVLRGHDFERDLPDAAKMHEAARLFESGGLGVRVSPADALRCHKFAAALGHRASRGVVGEYAETGAAERRRPRRARTLSRAAQDSTFRGAFISDSVRHRSRGWSPARPRRRRARRAGPVARRYRDAARDDDPRARYNLGRVFYHGLLGQRANRRTARLLFEKAARRKHRGAQAALGYMYEKAEGDLKADAARAQHYYAKAADQGCDRSAFNLGRLYETLLLAPPPDETAYDAAVRWRGAARQTDGPSFGFDRRVRDTSRRPRRYERAAKRGFERAADRLTKMAKPVGDDAPAPAPAPAAAPTDPESPPGSDASESDAAADDEAAAPPRDPLLLLAQKHRNRRMTMAPGPR